MEARAERFVPDRVTGAVPRPGPSELVALCVAAREVVFKRYAQRLAASPKHTGLGRVS